MLILCDVDGVLLDFTAAYLDVLYLVSGRRHYTHEITDFDYAKTVSSKAEDISVWQHIEKTPGLVYGLTPYDGVLEALAELRKNNRVVACTSPANPLWTAERAEWCLKVGGFSKKDIVIASDKSLIRGDALIDDAQHNIQSWCAANPYGRGILLSRPWNAAFAWADRIESLADVL